jgi:hypothetical protein
MGADLCSYIVVGPLKIEFTEELQDKVRAHAAKLVSLMRGIQAKIETGTPLTEEEEQASEYYEFTQFGDDYAIEEIESMLEYLDEEKMLEACKDLCKDWPFCYRDTNYREYEGKIILTAGEMTWGDEPEGTGYQTLKQMDKIGLLKLCGIN